jgi:hypothetical protein
MKLWRKKKGLVGLTKGFGSTRLFFNFKKKNKIINLTPKKSQKMSSLVNLKI